MSIPKILLVLGLLFSNGLPLHGQEVSMKEKYLPEQKIIANKFASYFYLNYARILFTSGKHIRFKDNSAQNALKAYFFQKTFRVARR